MADCVARVVARLRAGEYETEPFLHFPTDPAPDVTLHASLAGTDLAAVLGAAEEPHLLRAVHLRHADGADLTSLTMLPALGHVEVTAADVDLSPLAGLPLRTVRVAGGAVVDVPAWPRLVALDLGDARAANPRALPPAQFLTLHTDQWRALGSPPEGLAA
ncbi:hypothetical protein [Saccharothrix hoggarensis]|uniref:Leucine rich repeat (LRR) protein n=1 Tax=Saccharothrix hoggarensis TaxID=913853 RepID=A0ABW3QUL9_9PSEU